LTKEKKLGEAYINPLL